LQHLILAYGRNNQYHEAVEEFLRAKEIFEKTKNENWDMIKFQSELYEKSNHINFPNRQEGRDPDFKVKFRKEFEKHVLKKGDGLDFLLLAEMFDPHFGYRESDEKIKWLEKAAETNLNSTEPHLQLIDCYKQKENAVGGNMHSVRIRQHYEKALQLEPNNLSIHGNFALFLQEQGCSDEASLLFEKWYDLQKKGHKDTPMYSLDEEKMLNSVMQVFIRNKNFEKAYEIWKQNNQQPFFWGNKEREKNQSILAEICYLIDKEKASPRLLDSLIEDPNDLFARAYLLRGSLYEEKGMHEKALEDYKMAFELKHPSDVRTDYNHSFVLKDDESYQEYRERRIMSATAIIRYHNESGQLEKAVDIFKQASNINPHNLTNLACLGLCYKLLGRVKESAIEFEKLIETCINNDIRIASHEEMMRSHPNYRYENRILDEMPKDADAAIEFLKDKLQEDDGERERFTDKGLQLRYFLGKKYMKKDDFENASKILVDLLKQSSGTVEKIFENIEKKEIPLLYIDSVSNKLRKMAELAPQNPIVHIRIAEYHLRSNEKQEAMFEYFIASKLGNEEAKQKFEELKND
ncbi:hypothetical protein KY312_00145, partial [Candidatus Woesearchaeota archaeon]|nr:hypothetical protein [Candidatus Woesearchaeota archaeon]